MALISHFCPPANSLCPAHPAPPAVDTLLLSSDKNSFPTVPEDTTRRPSVNFPLPRSPPARVSDSRTVLSPPSPQRGSFPICPKPPPRALNPAFLQDQLSSDQTREVVSVRFQSLDVDSPESFLFRFLSTAGREQQARFKRLFLQAFFLSFSTILSPTFAGSSNARRFSSLPCPGSTVWAPDSFFFFRSFFFPGFGHLSADLTRLLLCRPFFIADRYSRAVGTSGLPLFSAVLLQFSV